MPRRLRLTLAGVAVHLIQRGNNRGACFFADEDYARYVDHLAEFAPKLGCAGHALKRTYRRSGTLWKVVSPPVWRRARIYVLACYRYIELNPVRAGIVCHLADCR